MKLSKKEEDVIHKRYYKETGAMGVLNNRLEYTDKYVLWLEKNVDMLFAIHDVIIRSWVVKYTLGDSDVLKHIVLDAPRQSVAEKIARIDLGIDSRIVSCKRRW